MILSLLCSKLSRLTSLSKLSLSGKLLSRLLPELSLGSELLLTRLALSVLTRLSGLAGKLLARLACKLTLLRKLTGLTRKRLSGLSCKLTRLTGLTRLTRLSRKLTLLRKLTGLTNKLSGLSGLARKRLTRLTRKLLARLSRDLLARLRRADGSAVRTLHRSAVGILDRSSVGIGLRLGRKLGLGDAGLSHSDGLHIDWLLHGLDKASLSKRGLSVLAASHGTHLGNSRHDAAPLHVARELARHLAQHLASQHRRIAAKLAKGNKLHNVGLHLAALKLQRHVVGVQNVHALKVGRSHAHNHHRQRQSRGLVLNVRKQK